MTEGQTEEPQQEQATPTFTSGFDFLNHHLNAAMRMIERAKPKDDAHIGPNTAFKLASQHTELARVGALASIAQALQGLTSTQGAAGAELANAVLQVAGQMHERNEKIFDESFSADLPAPGASWETVEASRAPQEPQDGPQEPRPPITRFRQRQAARLATETPPDSKDR